MEKFNLKPFDKVLVRDSHLEHWEISFYSRYVGEHNEFPYKCTGSCYKYCIPYKGNEHLLGTSKKPTKSDQKKRLVERTILVFSECRNERLCYDYYLFNGNYDFDGCPLCAAILKSIEIGGRELLTPQDSKSFRYPDPFNPKEASEGAEDDFWLTLGHMGYHYDDEAHKVVPHWQQGDTIFFVNASGEIISREFTNDSFFKELIKIGNAFVDAEDAKPYAEKIKKVFEENV